MNAMLAKVLPFLRKEEAAVDVKKIAVVANIADQASLVAATLYTLVKRQKGEQSVQLIDIRDAFPEADQYVWIDCGSASHLKEYFAGFVQASQASQSAQKAWYDGVVKKSLHIHARPQSGEELDPTCSVIGQVIYRLVEEELLQPDEIGSYMRLAVLSTNFHTDKIEKEDCITFYDILELAYQHYLGHPLTVGGFILTAPPSQLEIDLFVDHQKAVNQALVSKVREIIVGGRSVHYLTTVGPEVYGLIRRLRLAKKDFIHMSMGSYGTILYASVPVPAEMAEHKSLLKLAPEVVPVRKFQL